MSRRRANSDIFLLVGVLFVFGFLSYTMAMKAPEAIETGRPKRTTYSARPGGLKAWYLLLQRRGVPVQQWQRSPERWPKNAKVVVTATLPAPSATTGIVSWSDTEVKAARTWVEDGGTLIVLSEEDDTLIEKLGLGVSEHLKDDADLAPRLPSPFLTGIKAVRFPGAHRWDKVPADAVTLMGDRKPAFVAFARKKGMVLALSTPALAENRSIRLQDNARFLTQLVEGYAGADGRVLFDEYHQGFKDDDSLWKVIGRPGQLVTYQLLALVLLTVYSAGRRFGMPRPLARPPRVSSEYVTSLADLYRRAKASDAALEGVYLPFWRDLCRASGMPLDAKTEEVVPRAVAAIGGNSAAARDELQKRLQNLLNECEQKISDSGKTAINEQNLLRLARELENMRKELQLGGQD
jgi:hypothetical protein